MAQTKILNFEAATVWLNGSSLAGSVNEIELPEISWDLVDHETLALFGTPQFPNKLEGLECTITWAGYTTELAKAAANPFESVKLQVRANIGEYKSTNKAGDKALIIDLEGRFTNNMMGTFSPGEMERESTLVIDSVRERYDGVELFKLRINPPTLVVNGVDLYAQRNSNLGL